MHLFDHKRLCTIDLSDSQLSEDEQAEYVQRLEREGIQERDKERRIKAKRQDFRFVGGML